MSINIVRIQKFLETLGTMGRNAGGGITRLSYSSEFKHAQDFVRSYMENAGMDTTIDPIGNLIGTYRGKNPDLPAVVTGSHLDTVPNGGAFDGALGIAAALECVHSWHEQGWRPERTVKVIAFVEEEGTRFGMACFGSRTLLGEFQSQCSANIRDASGRSLAQLLEGMGLAPDPFSRADTLYRQAFCFIELHVEQGAELEKQAIPVGVVATIVGIDRVRIKMQGRANHAGTTPMDRRQDALVAAASIISYINEQALAAKGQYVATVGKLDVSPNEENIVPGEVRFTFEIRAEDVLVMDRVRREILSRIREAESCYHIKADVVKVNQVPPVKLDDGVIRHICGAGERLGIDYQKMPSWAGHDAMIFAQFVPTGMIFVPSVSGISHAPDERSDGDAIWKASQVLEETLKELAAS